MQNVGRVSAVINYINARNCTYHMFNALGYLCIKPQIISTGLCHKLCYRYDLYFSSPIMLKIMVA